MHRLTSRLRQPHLISTSPTTLRSTRTCTTPLLIPRISHRRITFRRPSNQQHQHSPPLQPVRIQQASIFSRKRQLTLALYILATYAIWKATGSITVEVKVEDNPSKPLIKKDSSSPPTGEEDASSEEEEEEEEEEEYTFIPLTWGKQMPREFYRGSDPEWLEFIKIARDKPRHKKIQDALVAHIFSNSKKHPALQMHLGKDLRVGKYWLDITFPDGPPQEYERWGLEIGDSGDISWAAERISPEEQFRLQRALWPSAIAKATYAAVRSVAGIQWRRVKQAVGWENVDPFSPEERLRLAIEMAEKQANAKNQKGKRGSGEIAMPGMLISRDTSSSTPTSDPSSDLKSRLPWPFRLSSPSSSSDQDPGFPMKGKDMMLPIAQIVFQTTLAKSGWVPKKMEPPRGTFVVQGMMEIRGSKGQILFDVKGCYDPVMAKFVAVQAVNRGVKSWEQRPKGGP